VNIGSVDPGQREEYWEHQCSAREKDSPGRQDVAREPHKRGRRETTYRGEALITTESFSERIVPNQTQTDSSDPRPEDTAGRALYDGCNEDGWEIRPQPEDQQPQGDGSDSRSNYSALGCGYVDEFASRNLCQQTCESADRQHETNIRRRPPAIRKIDCNKRSKPRQQSGKEEVQPIERLQTFEKRVGVSAME